MFSGIVEEVGRIHSFSPSSGRLAISAQRVLSGDDGLRISDSVSVSGACLTVTSLEATRFHVDVTPETQRATWFSELHPGAHVNLRTRAAFRIGRRRAPRAGAHRRSRQRHGHPLRWRRQTGNRPMCGNHFALCRRKRLRRYRRRVSLTAFDWRPDSFTFTLIPYTAIHTTLGVLKVGDTVNIETDQTGKYIERFVMSQER